MTGTEAETPRPPRLTRVLLWTGLVTLLLTAICFAVRIDNLTTRLFRSQDLAILTLGAGLLIFLAFWRGGLPSPRRISPSWTVLATAVLVLLVAWAGTWLVFGGYALTRDEILADFDAQFLVRGMLIAPVPTEWRGYAGALMPRYMLPTDPAIGWLSAYLPGNSALRAVGLATFGADWVNPALAAISILVIYRIGRRLWPDEPRLQLLPVLLLATSMQFLAMAMTSYAMPAHLAFNLIWLSCFLRSDRRGDAGALAAGFVATGLHQVLFHPLFVLPFIAGMWFSGGRRRALVYLAAYAAIGLFWICYWQIAIAGDATGHQAAGPGGISYLMTRIGGLITGIKWSAFYIMGMNLARFLSWQNLLLVPLVLLAWPAIRRGEGVARPLAAGFVLTVVTMAIILPWQGHGWGYRYIHGFLGSLALLAAYGWKRLDAGGLAPRARAALAVATAASLIVILPLHLKQAHDFVAPYRNAYDAIRTAPADLVLVDNSGMVFAEDLIRNAPDLGNRPKILYAPVLSGRQMIDLCTRYRVLTFSAREGWAFGIQPAGPVNPARARLPAQLGCGPPVSAP